MSADIRMFLQCDVIKPPMHAAAPKPLHWLLQIIKFDWLDLLWINRIVSEICEQTHRQTNIQIDILITLLCTSGGGAK